MIPNEANIDSKLLEKAKACTSPKELLALAESEVYELSDADLDGISGGWDIIGPVDGDFREDMNPAKAHVDYVNGIVDGGELA